MSNQSEYTPSKKSRQVGQAVFLILVAGFFIVFWVVALFADTWGILIRRACASFGYSSYICLYSVALLALGAAAWLSLVLGTLVIRVVFPHLFRASAESECARGACDSALRDLQRRVPAARNIKLLPSNLDGGVIVVKGTVESEADIAMLREELKKYNFPLPLVWSVGTADDDIT